MTSIISLGVKNTVNSHFHEKFSKHTDVSVCNLYTYEIAVNVASESK